MCIYIYIYIQYIMLSVYLPFVHSSSVLLLFCRCNNLNILPTIFLSVFLSVLRSIFFHSVICFWFCRSVYGYIMLSVILSIVHSVDCSFLLSFVFSFYVFFCPLFCLSFYHAVYSSVIQLIIQSVVHSCSVEMFFSKLFSARNSILQGNELN